MRKLRRIFGNQFARRIHKDGCLGVRYLFDTLPFSVVEIPTDRNAIFLNFRLLVVAVENKASCQRTVWISVRDYITVLVVGESLIGIEPVRVLVYGRVRCVGYSDDILCKAYAVAVSAFHVRASSGHPRKPDSEIVADYIKLMRAIGPFFDKVLCNYRSYCHQSIRHQIYICSF